MAESIFTLAVGILIGLYLGIMLMVLYSAHEREKEIDEHGRR